MSDPRTNEERFGELRALLERMALADAPWAHSYWISSIGWGSELWPLLQHQHKVDPEYYRSVWVPYLSGRRDVNEVILREVTPDNVEETWRFAPFGALGLRLSTRQGSMWRHLSDTYPITQLTLTHDLLGLLGLRTLVRAEVEAPPRALGVYGDWGSAGSMVLAESRLVEGLRALDWSSDMSTRVGHALARNEVSGGLSKLALRCHASSWPAGSEALLEAELPSLRSLTLDPAHQRFRGQDHPARVFGRAHKRPNLEHLHIDQTILDAHTIEVLANALRHSKLKTLSFGLGTVDVDAMCWWLSQAEAQTLHTLKIQAPWGRSDELIRIFAEGDHFDSLEHLELDSGGMSDENAFALANATHLSGLRVLRVGNGRDFTERGRRALRESPYVGHAYRE